MNRGRVRFKHLIAWLGRNFDPILALSVAVVIMAMELSSDTNLAATVISNGTLIVLGALAVAVLRDRHRKDETEQRLEEEIKQSAAAHATLTAIGEQSKRVDSTLNNLAEVLVLHGHEVREQLADARNNTQRWLFRGGTGTYIRAVTLADCVNRARLRRMPLQVRLEIIDPTHEKACQTYVRFRQSLPGDNTDWDMERVQRESYATILACCWHRQRFDLLNVEVALSPTMPTLRWEMSSDQLIITQESSEKPALLVYRGRQLFQYIETELENSFRQATQVPLYRAEHLTLGRGPQADPTLDEVRELFTELDLPLPVTYSDDDVTDIIERALRAENAYDR